MSLLRSLFGPNPAELAAARSTLPANLPFEIVPVRGRTAVADWQRLRDAWRPAGFCPVVLGDATNVSAVFTNYSANERTTAEILASAGTRSAAQFFAGRQSGETDQPSFDDEGNWPFRAPKSADFTIHRDLFTGKTKDIVFIARLPTTTAAEIPALLKFGHGDEGPSAADHVSVLRHWDETYGVEIFGLTSDRLECRVARPPATRQNAMTLAREQYLYCNDIVEQGTESLPILAATLIHASNWYFWWD